MFSLLAFVLVYVFGGLTLIPFLLGLAFAVLPRHTNLREYPSETFDHGGEETADSVPLAKQYQRNHELDVAAGYFAVCREYVPGGQNGKPPERTTPAGEVIVEESPSVYQSMYRSIFDRKPLPTLDPGKANGKPLKKANNVFYIVLRHRHLMLFDSIEQIVVRHVISLDHHDISIYGGGNEIPEGELWIKRNAICLTRKPSVGDVTSTSKPFYLFCENCSAKEDFYFALLQNQERLPGMSVFPPRPQQFELKDIISLVQKLHSSEEHLQTRWINAFIGRIFLAMYKTQAIEDCIRLKITKKIARVQKPAFLSGILLQKVDMGHSAPYITNPRLKDLNVDGECCAEADLRYSGKVRIEVAATARIELGTRFRPREVHLVLAVVLKKLEGHVLLRLKPPPSNRLWFSFEKMPVIEMHIEPIVSSRQITYGIILRAIESRIREVIAETLVLPHWDDNPFTDTVNQHFRGGIWMKDEMAAESLPTQNDSPVDNCDNTKQSNELDPHLPALPAQTERSSSLPLPIDPPLPSPGLGPEFRKEKKSPSLSADHPDLGVATGIPKKPEMPKAIRTLSTSSSTATPVLSTDHASTENVMDEFNRKQHKPSATSAMIAISNKSQPTSPTITPAGSPPLPQSHEVLTTSHSTITENHEFSSAPSPNITGLSRSLTDAFGHETLTSKPSSVSQQPLNPSDKGKTIAAIGATAVAAKKWGWSVLNRNNNEQKAGVAKSTLDRGGFSGQPMGRGRPIPFPNPLTMPKRKALPPPLLPDRRHQASASDTTVPALPYRHNQRASDDTDRDNDSVLVVEAPPASEPGSPLSNQEEFVYQMKIRSEDEDEEVQEEQPPFSLTTTSLKPEGNDLTSSMRFRNKSSKVPRNDGEHGVSPPWTATQEDVRAQSMWADESTLA